VLLLVLSRKPGQMIDIADGVIKLTIVEIRGNVVRLGFAAPRDIAILRTEVLEREQETELDDAQAG
jgi:carbon storage regulator